MGSEWLTFMLPRVAGIVIYHKQTATLYIWIVFDAVSPIIGLIGYNDWFIHANAPSQSALCCKASLIWVSGEMGMHDKGENGFKSIGSSQCSVSVPLSPCPSVQTSVRSSACKHTKSIGEINTTLQYGNKMSVTAGICNYFQNPSLKNRKGAERDTNVKANLKIQESTGR